MDYWKIIAPILIGILIYVGLGSIFVYLGTTIYDDFPTTNFTFSEYVPHSVILRNNAPFSFPFVNPAFIGYINIIDGKEQINCFVESGKGKIPCESNSIDLGYIPAGEDKNFKVYITPSNNYNFTIQINSYLNFLIKNIQTKSKSFECTYEGNNLYFCRQI